MNIEQLLQQNQDRLSIRDLIDQYAYCADNRDAQGQMSLFAENSIFEVYYDPKSEIPTEVYTGRASLKPVFNNLNTYKTTMHFNGQSTITALSLNTASGITYCIAHHQTLEEGLQKLMIADIRYEDQFIKEDDKWLFAERKLLVDMIENR